MRVSVTRCMYIPTSSLDIKAYMDFFYFIDVPYISPPRIFCPFFRELECLHTLVMNKFAILKKRWE